jgi:hypothetical protein
VSKATDKKSAAVWQILLYQTDILKKAIVIVEII